MAYSMYQERVLLYRTLLSFLPLRVKHSLVAADATGALGADHEGRSK